MFFTALVGAEALLLVGRVAGASKCLLRPCLNKGGTCNAIREGDAGKATFFHPSLPVQLSCSFKNLSIFLNLIQSIVA